MKRGTWVEREFRSTVNELDKVGGIVETVQLDPRDFRALHDLRHPTDTPHPCVLTYDWSTRRRGDRYVRVRAAD